MIKIIIITLARIADLFEKKLKIKKLKNKVKGSNYLHCNVCKLRENA